MFSRLAEPYPKTVTIKGYPVVIRLTLDSYGEYNIEAYCHPLKIKRVIVSGRIMPHISDLDNFASILIQQMTDAIC